MSIINMSILFGTSMSFTSVQPTSPHTCSTYIHLLSVWIRVSDDALGSWAVLPHQGDIHQLTVILSFYH
jgi:hypothetical protein